MKDNKIPFLQHSGVQVANAKFLSWQQFFFASPWTQCWRIWHNINQSYICLIAARDIFSTWPSDLKCQRTRPHHVCANLKVYVPQRQRWRKRIEVCCTDWMTIRRIEFSFFTTRLLWAGGEDEFCKLPRAPRTWHCCCVGQQKQRNSLEMFCKHF